MACQTGVPWKRIEHCGNVRTLFSPSIKIYSNILVYAIVHKVPSWKADANSTYSLDRKDFIPSRNSRYEPSESLAIPDTSGCN